MSVTQSLEGRVFKPSLQDISLKRFRLRYTPGGDCYYLHWNDTVCAELARVRGLQNGVCGSPGVSRVEDITENKAYLAAGVPKQQQCSDEECAGDGDGDGCDAESDNTIRWSVDFSECGLAIKHISLKARSSSPRSRGKAPVSFNIVRDNMESYSLDGLNLNDHAELPVMYGSTKFTLSATLPHQDYTDFLSCDLNDATDCPLDIKINLMCNVPDSWEFAGELLLGMKYNTTGAAESLRDKEDITVDCGVMGGQLQVHIVQGAGLIKKGSSKSYNAYVKCELLHDPSKAMVKQTSPMNSSYPTWAKEIIFAGLDHFDLTTSGLQLTVYDRRTLLHDTIMGGLRLSQPRPVHSTHTSPCHLIQSVSPRSTSPEQQLVCLTSPRNTLYLSPSPSPTMTSFQTEFNALPMSPQLTDTILLVSSDEFHSDGNTLPATLSPSPSSSELSNRVRRVPVFSLPRANSPFSSPLLSRKHRKSPSPLLSPRASSTRSTPVQYDCLDSEGSEVSHWQNMLDTAGEWVYCWHLLRPNFTPVPNS